MTIQAATLAVGTEVTDGQIIDRNSAWISAKLVRAGVQVVEHRAVADDREDIRRALRELSARVDHLFVTGGLGPTSDDFTRDLLSEVYGRPLEFDPASWKHIEDRLRERGIQAKEIQKQQCYFPRGARILLNTAGTANAFSFDGEVVGAGDKVKVYALPGPPAEIAAVWEKNLASEIEALTPENEREELMIFRCLGRGESDIAELTEEAIRGSGLRVGYRAHLPYVEVKLWVRDRARAKSTLDRVQTALSTWIVNRDEQDATDALIEKLRAGSPVLIQDSATGGVLQERILLRLREKKLAEGQIPLTIQTSWSKPPSTEALDSVDFLQIKTDEAQAKWLVSWRNSQNSGTLEVSPTFNYKLATERARRYITEKALLLFGSQS